LDFPPFSDGRLFVSAADSNKAGVVVEWVAQQRRWRPPEAHRSNSVAGRCSADVRETWRARGA